MSDLLAGAGVLLAAGASASAILIPPGRRRSVAMLAAIALFPLLILGDQWHSHQIVDLRHHADRIVALALAGIAAAAVLAAIFRRWPIVLPLAIVAALPFRVPLHAGGDTANLLVPLYLVISAGVLAVVLRDWAASRAGGGGRGPRTEPLHRPQAPSPRQAPRAEAARWLPRILAAVVVLYAVQTLYSADFSKGLQNVCFFLVPFTVAYALLSDFEWDRKLLTSVLWVVAIEAVAFVVVGSVEYVSRSLFWNDQVIRSNDFHTYFRVNSVFWDPNIYGRYLALVIVVATATLLWAKERRDVVLLTALVAVLWVGLVPTFSQSSFIALLAGLAVLAALRWSLRWTLATVGVGLVAGVLFVALVGGASKINFSRINIDTRPTLPRGHPAPDLRLADPASPQPDHGPWRCRSTVSVPHPRSRRQIHHRIQRYLHRNQHLDHKTPVRAHQRRRLIMLCYGWRRTGRLPVCAALQALQDRLHRRRGIMPRRRQPRGASSR